MNDLFKIIAILNLYILTPIFIWGFYKAYAFEPFNFFGWGLNAIGVFGYFVCLFKLYGR